MWFILGTVLFVSGFILGVEFYKALEEHKKEKKIKKDADAEDLAARISKKLKINEEEKDD